MAVQRRGHSAHRSSPATTCWECWDRLQKQGIEFMTAPPEAYYEMLDERLPGHGEPIDELQVAASSWMGLRKTMTLACCCRSSQPTWLARHFSNLFSARKTRVSAKATSRRCLNRSNATRSRAASSAPRHREREMDIKRIHHVAYRCKDAKETVEFYQRY